ncbi:ABC transporter permease [Carboxylicivirga sp. M1479]|uniref:ABC transporter permease n=1 Tax=Carboxylicivirga sp. M1479 TaxID=2594476 RepID=UPI0011783293|nr:FtsX-like permease family protein [Carboxylicivirga sp. M1479]TRX70414.1 FtsX-like permease family protein [Carboxylicivirga sp. M1479]
MIAFKLAYKNLLGAGLRTWLNVSVLSLAFVLIIFYNAMIDGWNRQGRNDTQNWEIAQGQYWHPEYDKYDVYTINDAHQALINPIQKHVDAGRMVPELLQQASIYPQGRMQSIILRGIPSEQSVLKLPTHLLKSDSEELIALIGKRMAKASKLKLNDTVLLRWRDKNGTFDAAEMRIGGIFNCDVAEIDNGQIYISYALMQNMMGLSNEATLLVDKLGMGEQFSDWDFKSPSFLLKELDELINSERISGMVMQLILLLIALLAIFDTQILAIFRRKKEIGTYIALGLTRQQVVRVFTIEGGMHSVLAALLGAVYGIPLFMWIDSVGINFGSADMGITIAERVYPYYSLQLVLITIVVVVVSSTIVSFIPARKIARMKPTDALKGKM